MNTASNASISARHAQEYRSWIRRQVQMGASTCSIVAVEGSSEPRVEGESYYYTNARGERIRHPNAYRHAWGKPIYHCSTVRITVGRDWLSARRIPVAALAL